MIENVISGYHPIGDRNTAKPPRKRPRKDKALKPSKPSKEGKIKKKRESKQTKVEEEVSPEGDSNVDLVAEGSNRCRCRRTWILLLEINHHLIL